MSDIAIDYSNVRNLTDLISILRSKKIPPNQYWSYVSAYQEKKAREKGIPLHGLFELTPLCNLDCKMCYVHLNNNQLNGEKILSFSQWKDIIIQAHEMGMINATLTGGECLTYPEFDDIYLFLRSLGIKSGIKTNGVLLNKERIDFFKKNQPRSITVSIYGSNNDAYKNVTGYALFDTVYENLQLLKSVDFPVSIAITPCNYMYNDITGILEFVKNLGFRYSINIALFTPRQETGRSLCDLSNREYLNIYKLLGSKGITPRTISEEKEVSKNYESENSHLGHLGIRCGAGRSSFNISWNGLMSGCVNLNSITTSVLDKSFSAAWKFINQNARIFPLPVECTKCQYDAVCYDCVAYRTNGMPIGHCNPNICERTKMLIEEGIYSI